MAKVSRHEISMSGTSGSIFWFLMGATVVCAIGLATPAWWVNDRQTQGLWQKCECDTHNKDDDWFRAVQAMMVLSMLCILVAALLAIIYQFCHCCDMNCTLIVTGLIALLSVVAAVIGLTIYGVKMQDENRNAQHYNYSFAFECIGALFALIAAVLCLVQYCRAN